MEAEALKEAEELEHAGEWAEDDELEEESSEEEEDGSAGRGREGDMPYNTLGALSHLDVAAASSIAAGEVMHHSSRSGASSASGIE